MKTLILGGAGFIGANFCRYLISKNIEVYCIDNLSSGKLINLEPVIDNEVFHFIKGDIVKDIRFKEKVDYVLHFASLASPIDYIKYPIPTMLSNSLGTYNILKIVKEMNVPLVFTSSSEIYGNPKSHPQREDSFGDVPLFSYRSCYSESKRFAETLLWNYSKKYNLDIKIARLFNVYGPLMRSDDGRVIPNFIMAALNNRPIEIYGSGEQTRSFCYIDDVNNALYKLMISDFKGAINIGNPNEIKIIDLAELIKERTNSKSSIVHKPPLEDDPKRRCPDITLAEEVINWKPKVDLKTGLDRTINWFRDTYFVKERLK